MLVTCRWALVIAKFVDARISAALSKAGAFQGVLSKPLSTLSLNECKSRSAT
jgi:hypothetical protein